MSVALYNPIQCTPVEPLTKLEVYIGGIFVRMMGVGNVKAVPRLITEENSQSLPLDSLQTDGQTLRKHLLEKHPSRQQCMDKPEPEPHPLRLRRNQLCP